MKLILFSSRWSFARWRREMTVIFLTTMRDRLFWARCEKKLLRNKLEFLTGSSAYYNWLRNLRFEEEKYEYNGLRALPVRYKYLRDKMEM